VSLRLGGARDERRKLGCTPRADLGAYALSLTSLSRIAAPLTGRPTVSASRESHQRQRERPGRRIPHDRFA
jgi:hypothetical protein